MKRILILIAALSIAVAAAAQERTELKSKVFTIHNRDPHAIANSIRLLGSGMPKSGVDVNEELRTVTVRDYPENLATIEDAIKRLDQPQTESASADLRISVLMGSKGARPGSVPEDLEPVVKELRTALRYDRYVLLTTAVQRVSAGVEAQGSGLIDPDALGTSKTPATYNYHLRRIGIATGERPSVSTDDFAFHMKASFDVNGQPDYHEIGFNTPVTIRDGENVVIGTTTFGDRALIVVVNARIGGK